MTALLQLTNLACEIDDRVLFSGLNETFQPGEVVQIRGPNGVGKTTLLRAITGLNARYKGEIRWLGEDGQLAWLQRDLLYLGHNPAVNEVLSPLENLRWFFSLHGVKNWRGNDAAPDAQAIFSALEAVSLGEARDSLCHQLSAGQKRRVALARLFISQARVWVLDEPFTAIDVEGVEKLEVRIAEHARQGGLVLLTSHQTFSALSPRVLDLSDYQPVSA